MPRTGSPRIFDVGRRLVAGSAVVVAILLATAVPALAHAFLISSNPDPGARLARAPSAITLSFSEALARQGTSVHLTVVDHERDLSLALQLSGGDRVVRASLPTARHGVYEVSWQATSAEDGHVTSGTFAFAVGHVGGQLAGPTSTTRGPEPLVTAASWLAFVGIALALGGLAVGTLADPSVTASAGSVRLGLVVAFIGTAFTSLESVSGIGRGGRAPPQVVGLSVVAMGVVGLALAASTWVTSRWPEIALLLVAILLVSGVGHGRADLGTVGWVVEGVHFAAVATWLGALVHLALRLRRRRGTIEELWPLARGYARLAVWAVLVLAGSGAFLAVSLLPKLSDLWTTSYGEILVAKSTLLAIALVIAVLGRQLGIRGRNFALLRRSMPIEIGVLGVILVLSSVLIGVGPPRPGLAVGALLGAPPLRATVLRVGGLAGELTVGIALSDRQLQIEVYAATNQIAGTITASTRSPGRPAIDVPLVGCGPGCATAAMRPARGMSEIAVTASAPGWRGGTFATRVVWPPLPEDPGLLAKVVATMRAVPRLRVTEIVRTGPYSAAPYTATLRGTRFISGEPYVAGADDVRLLAGKARGLTLYLPGDEIWVTLVLDARDRIVREQLINASDQLNRTFAYPVG